MDTNEPKSSDPFENKVRSLSPSSASVGLRQRLEKSLSTEEQTHNRSPIFVFVAAAAVVAIGCVLFVMSQTGIGRPEIAENNSFQSIGQQHFIVDSSDPVLVEIPDAAPMWQIDMKLLNRDFIETPEGIVPTPFEPENRSVFLPVVYH